MLDHKPTGHKNSRKAPNNALGNEKNKFDIFVLKYSIIKSSKSLISQNFSEFFWTFNWNRK